MEEEDLEAAAALVPAPPRPPAGLPVLTKHTRSRSKPCLHPGRWGPLCPKEPGVGQEVGGQDWGGAALLGDPGGRGQHCSLDSASPVLLEPPQQGVHVPHRATGLGTGTLPEGARRLTPGELGGMATGMSLWPHWAGRRSAAGQGGAGGRVKDVRDWT